MWGMRKVSARNYTMRMEYTGVRLTILYIQEKFNFGYEEFSLNYMRVILIIRVYLF